MLLMPPLDVLYSQVAVYVALHLFGAILQNGPRGRREREFYERVRTELCTEKAARLRAAAQTSVSEDISDEDDQASVSGRSDDDADTQANLPFSVRNAAMLAAVPRFCKPFCCSLTSCCHPLTNEHE